MVDASGAQTTDAPVPWASMPSAGHSPVGSTDRISLEIGAWLGAIGSAMCAVAQPLPRPATSNA